MLPVPGFEGSGRDGRSRRQNRTGAPRFEAVHMPLLRRLLRPRRRRIRSSEGHGVQLQMHPLRSRMEEPFRGPRQMPRMRHRLVEHPSEEVQMLPLRPRMVPARGRRSPEMPFMQIPRLGFIGRARRCADRAGGGPRSPPQEMGHEEVRVRRRMRGHSLRDRTGPSRDHPHRHGGDRKAPSQAAIYLGYCIFPDWTPLR